MRHLLWKDLRLNAVALTAAGLLLVAPYLYMLARLLRHTWPDAPRLDEWGSMVAIGTAFAMGLSSVSLAILAGNSIACERTNRSATFLASLPVRRARVALSKAILLVVATLVVWAVLLAILYGVAPALYDEAFDDARGIFDHPLRVMIFPSLAALGLGWAASARSASPDRAIILGVIGMLLVPIAAMGLWSLTGWTGESFGHAIAAAQAAVGVLAAVLGTVYYLRRVEP